MSDIKESLMDSMLVKIVATLLIVILGQGLMIWKNQDAFNGRLNEVEKDIVLVVDINNKVIKLQENKIQAFMRIDKLEEHVVETSLDRNSRGGSFRRDDSEIMKKYLLDKIDIGSGRLNVLDYKMSNAENSLNECKNRSNNYAIIGDLNNLEEDIIELEDEFETAYKSLTERCENVIELLEEIEEGGSSNGL